MNRVQLAPSPTPAVPRTSWDLRDLTRPIRREGRARHRWQPKLLPHYPAVVEFLYRHRYATAAQVQRAFPETIRTARTARYQLQQLQRLGYVATAPVRSLGPHFPHSHFTTPSGIELIRDTYRALGHEPPEMIGEQHRSRGYARDFIHHELLVTEFDLAMREAVQQRDDLTLISSERRFFRSEHQLRFTSEGRTMRLDPDSGFIVTTSIGDGLQVNIVFVEMDRGTMPARRMFDKYHRYNDWITSDRGEQYLARIYEHFGDPRPPDCSILTVIHAEQGARGDEPRLSELLTESLRLPRTMQRRMWFALGRDFGSASRGTPLTHPGCIWLRFPRELRSLTPDSLRGHGRNKPQFPRLSRYAFFPRADAHQT